MREIETFIKPTQQCIAEQKKIKGKKLQISYFYLCLFAINFNLTDFRSDPPCSDMFCLRLNRLFLPHMARQFKRIQINFFGNPDSSG